jgi:hypothetical protein
MNRILNVEVKVLYILNDKYLNGMLASGAGWSCYYGFIES